MFAQQIANRAYSSVITVSVTMQIKKTAELQQLNHSSHIGLSESLVKPVTQSHKELLCYLHTMQHVQSIYFCWRYHTIVDWFWNHSTHHCCLQDSHASTRGLSNTITKISTTICRYTTPFHRLTLCIENSVSPGCQSSPSSRRQRGQNESYFVSESARFGQDVRKAFKTHLLPPPSRRLQTHQEESTLYKFLLGGMWTNGNGLDREREVNV